MKELTKAEMEEILLAHELAELNMDLEASLETVASDPHYELVFADLALDGRDAIVELYGRILHPDNQINFVAAKQRIHAVDTNTLAREAHVTFTDKEGKRVNGQYLVVLQFDPEEKKILGERMYADPNFGAMMCSIIGDDLIDTPGVSRLADKGPVLEEHDAFEEAAKRGITYSKQ